MKESRREVRSRANLSALRPGWCIAQESGEASAKQKSLMTAISAPAGDDWTAKTKCAEPEAPSAAPRRTRPRMPLEAMYATAPSATRPVLERRHLSPHCRKLHTAPSATRRTTSGPMPSDREIWPRRRRSRAGTRAGATAADAPADLPQSAPSGDEQSVEIGTEEGSTVSSRRRRCACRRATNPARPRGLRGRCELPLVAAVVHDPEAGSRPCARRRSSPVGRGRPLVVESPVGQVLHRSVGADGDNLR